MDMSEARTSGNSLLTQDVYCVCFQRRDSVDVLQGELAMARKKYFTDGKKTVKVGRREVVKGFDGDLRGKISRWSFYWKKSVLGMAGDKAVVLEESFDQKGGYVLVTRDFRGIIVSRTFYNKEHAWQKTEYYEPWDSSSARVMFKPALMEDSLERFDWDGEKKLYRSTILHPAPYRAGTAEQALVNARFGEPQLILSMEVGLLCYCPQGEAAARTQALDEISSGTMVLMPAWEIKDGAFTGDGDEDGEESHVTFTSLEEYAKIEAPALPQPPEPPLAPAPVLEAEAADVPPAPEPAPADMPLQGTAEEEEPAAGEEPAALPGHSPDIDVEFILADVREDEAQEAPVLEEEPAQEPEPEPEAWAEVPTELSAEEEPVEEESPLPPAQPVETDFYTETPEPEESPVLPVVREVLEQEQPKRGFAPSSTYQPSKHSESPVPRRAQTESPLGQEDASILSAARRSSQDTYPPKGNAYEDSRKSYSGAPARHSTAGLPPKRSAHQGEEPAILSAARHSSAAPGHATSRGGSQSGLGLEDTSILAAARRETGDPLPRRSRPANGHSAPLPQEDAAILDAARRGAPTARQAPPPPYPAGKGHTGPRHSGPQDRPVPPPAPPAQAMERAQPATSLDPMRSGRQSGKGRAQQPGGLTAYEGDYQDGRRQGFGSHYYKSGDLSYAGFWQGDKKDGLGASFREGDHALHVSRWVQGRPGQVVSLFDKEGTLRYGGRIINGKKEGAGVSISSQDGSVLVTKWIDGENTGLASAFDPEGNLLYYGSWKNGKRHGHGTEFDKNGGIVFDGEFRDGEYYNGILYQKPAEDAPALEQDSQEPDWDA